MKNIFLHIGTHKTGTSSIQRTLKTVNTTLNSLDYQWVEESYWLYKRFTPEAIDDVVSYIDSLSFVPQQNLIFSSEGYTAGLLSDMAIVRQRAEILATILSDFNVKVVLYLRRQDQFIESMYSQAIHEGHSYTFDEYFSEVCDFRNLDWQILIDIFAGQFGKDNLIVRPYDRNLFYQNDIVPDFFSSIGLKDRIPAASFSKSMNRSYSSQGLKIARYMNSILPDIEEKEKLRAMMQGMGAKDVFEKHAYFAPDTRRQLMDTFNASNESISKQYFNQDQNVFALSASDFNIPVVDTATISNEDIVAIMMKFFLTLCQPRQN